MRSLKARWTLSLGALIFLLCSAGHAAAQKPFYEGKTLNIIQGRRPGGTGDMRVRAIVPVLRKHIPGNPTIVMGYMPGAGGRKAANFMYKAVRKDGLTISNATVGIVVNGVTDAPGVKYDLDKFDYLGSPYSANFAVFVTWKDKGFDSLEKLRAASGVRVGGQSVGFITYVEARVFAYFLDLKDPVFITGYSGSEMDLALQRGEIDARASAGETALRRHPDWIEKNLAHFHAALESPKGYRIDHPKFKNVPAITTFARSDKERALLDMARSFRYSGTPWTLPPGVPKERVAILQNAMRKTLKDPEFYKNYKRLTGVDATPLMPEDQAKAIRGFQGNPEILNVLKKIAGPGPLPPRMK